MFIPVVYKFKMSTYISCPFCCKSKDNKQDYEKAGGKRLLLSRFSNFLERHLRISRPQAALLLSWPTKRIMPCQDCFTIITCICDLYQEINTVELHLKWKLQSLKDIVRLADKVKSRQHLFKVILEGGSADTANNDQMTENATGSSDNFKLSYSKVQSFRKTFLAKCSEVFLNSYPMVTLVKNEKAVDDYSAVAADKINPKNVNGYCSNQSILSQCCCTNYERAITTEKSMLGFIGWTISFAMVTLLSFPLSSSSQDVGIPESLVDDNEKFSLSDDEQQSFIMNKIEIISLPPCMENHSAHKTANLNIPKANLDNNEAVLETGLLSADEIISPTIAHDCDNRIDVDNVTVSMSSTGAADLEPDIKTMEWVDESMDGASDDIDFQSISIHDEITTNPIEDQRDLITVQEVEQPTVVTNDDSNSVTTKTFTLSVEKREEESPPPKRYNLRKLKDANKKRVNQYDDSFNSSDLDDDTEKDSTESETSSNCSSSSDSSDSEVEKSEKKTNTGTSSSSQLNGPKQCPHCKKMYGRTIKHHMHFCKRVKPEYFCKERNCNNIDFPNAEEYEYHKSLHGNFTCSFCDFSDTFAPSLCLHEATHSTLEDKVEGYFYCPKCPSQFQKRRKYFVRHYLSIHMNIQNSTNETCSVCQTRVPKGHHKFHFLSHHGTGDPDAVGVLQCEVEGCKAYFVSRNQLYKHILQQHDGVPTLLSRQRSDETIRNSDNQTKTKEIEPAEENLPKLYSCRWCTRKFKIKSWLETHERRHIARVRRLKPGKNTVKCDKCKEKLTTEKSLEEHSKLHDIFQCNFCEVEKDFAPDLAIHELLHNIRNSADNEGGAAGQEKQLQESLGSGAVNLKLFNCPRCKFKSTRKSNYITHHVEVHMKLNHRSCTCDVCGIRSLNENSAVIHFSMHHNVSGLEPSDVHRCDQCPAYFIFGDQLYTHKRHIHKIDLICYFCNDTFKLRCTLNSHIKKIHPNADDSHLPEVCDDPDCGRRFMTREERDWHISLDHISHEKYGGSVKCKKCEKVFRGQKALLTHMRRHFGKYGRKKMTEAFVCDECGKQFKSKLNLRAHVLFHQDPSTWPFQCSTCSKRCSSRQKLEEHMRVHSKEKPFVCEKCGEKYAHRHNYRHHMQNKHDIVVPRPPAQKRNTWGRKPSQNITTG